MVDRLAPPLATVPIVDNDGTMSPIMRAFTQKASVRALIIGTGDPESVIEAEQGALFLDTNANVGDVLYVKRLADIGGDKTQGWRAV